MAPETVLILGANGRFGAAAVTAFSAAGWRVLAQVRRPPARPFPAGVSVLNGALSDTPALLASAAGAHTVVYAVNPPYTDWQKALLPLARQGMAVAEQLGAHFMLPGNIYNFGERMPAKLTPQTAPQPSNAKGRLRCDLEGEMRQRAAIGLRCTVIRAGDFYGAGAGSWLDQLIVKDLPRGKLAYPGPLTVPHAWAYLPDLARAFVAVAAREREGLAPSPFECFHFAGHTLTGHELLAHIEAAAVALGLRPAAGFRVGSMPWGLIRTVGLVYPLWRELARMRYLWQVPHALDGTALNQAVGAPVATAPHLALHAALLALGLGQGSAGLGAAVPN